MRKDGGANGTLSLRERAGRRRRKFGCRPSP
jgi:hypothetical protein